MRIINAATVAEERVKNGECRVAKVYAGTAEENLSAKSTEVYGKEQYKIGSAKWKNSAGYFALWDEIGAMQHSLKQKNAANPATSTELAAYYAKLFIDVQRQADDLLDITPFIANIIKAEDAQEVSYVRNWLPFVGKEEVISGTNDKVPLMDEAAAVAAS